MNKNQMDKTNLAAYRVFETLKFLIRKPATVQDIVKYLEDLDKDYPKGYSAAVVYKYLTTLKFAGINIVRHKCKYEVKNLPFKINFSEDNIKALAILNNVLETIPEKKLSEKFTEFFYQLKMRYSLNSELFEEKKEVIKESLNITTPNSEQVLKLLEYEKYCNDKIRLQISYLDIDGEVQTSIFEPLESIFEDKQVLISLFCTKTNSFMELNSKQIIEIKQTPLKCSGKFFASSTVFKLSGNLARTYTLRNDEQSLGIDEKGVLTVLSKNEPKEKLLLRLIRYSDLCEVSTSRKDREAMINIIEKTLSNYEGT